MTDETKPVTLTEAERKQTDRDNLADLIHEAVNAGEDDLSFDLAYSIAGCFVDSEWLKEHVAAARREALLEAADAYSDFEVYIDTDGHRSMRQHRLQPDAWIRRYSETALAETERDEEGGR